MQSGREIVRIWITNFPPQDDLARGQQLAACRCAVAYVHALMYHLRGEDPLDHPDCSDLIPRTKNGNLAIETDNPEVKRVYKEPKSLTSFRLPGS